MSTHHIHFHDYIRNFPQKKLDICLFFVVVLFCFLLFLLLLLLFFEQSEELPGDSKTNQPRKRGIGVRVIEVLLYTITIRAKIYY